MSGLHLLEDAWGALRRNRQAAAWYIGLSVLINVAYGLCFIYEESVIPRNSAPVWQSQLDLVIAVIVAALLSVPQAILFARIGKEMDRPLWKCNGDGDALRRFFMPWFIMNLIAAAIANFEIQNRDADDVLATLEFCMMILYVVFIPIGACVMYWGRLNWRQLPETLAPIAQQFLPTLVVMGLGFIEFLVRFFSLSSEFFLKNMVGIILISGISAFLECLAFAAMWRVCMLHRDSPYSHDSDTFDF